MCSTLYIKKPSKEKETKINKITKPKKQKQNKQQNRVHTAFLLCGAVKARRTFVHDKCFDGF